VYPLCMIGLRRVASYRGFTHVIFPSPHIIRLVSNSLCPSPATTSRLPVSAVVLSPPIHTLLKYEGHETHHCLWFPVCVCTFVFLCAQAAGWESWMQGRVEEARRNEARALRKQQLMGTGNMWLG
jgi:hypothetical protein